MKHKSFTGSLLSVCACLALTASAQAVTIVNPNGNPGNSGTDNVLFNDSSLLHSGPLVQGNFNDAGLAAFVVEFTSTSGNKELLGTGGQAAIEGAAGNDPLTNLAFGINGGVSFTKAVFNIIAEEDDTVDFTVFLTGGGTHNGTFPLSKNGNNWFGVFADAGETISSISFTADGGMSEVKQIRIGGIAGAPVPEGGATAGLLGASLCGLAVLRGRMRRVPV